MDNDRLAEFNRQNILQSAKKLFEQKGIIKTTMDDIAKDASYSKSTLYVYFKGKDEIYNHLVHAAMLELKNIVKTAINNGDDFMDKYLRVCAKLVQFYRTHPLYFDSILEEINVNIKDLDADNIFVKIYDTGEQINQIVKAWIDEGKRIGDVSSKASSMQITLTMWASISGVVKFAHKKEQYIQKSMNITKEQFLEDSFYMIIKSIAC